MNLREAIGHPISRSVGALSVALGVIGIAVKPVILHAVAAAVWGNIGTLFTAFSITRFTILPNLPVPGWAESVGLALTLAAGGVYVAKLVDRVIDAYEKRT